MYTETPPTKYVSAIMYDGQFVVDLHKYGARPIIQPYVLWLDSGRHFFMHPGVVLSADIINDFLFFESDRYYITNYGMAIQKYNVTKKLKGILKSLVYLYMHFRHTMEKTYTPGGAGYKRVLSTTLLTTYS